MRGRVVIIALALAAVAIAYAASGSGGEHGEQERPRATAAPTAATDAVHVALVYSPEKRSLLAPLIKRFNAQRLTSATCTASAAAVGAAVARGRSCSPLTPPVPEAA